jgi:hypothetical protein
MARISVSTALRKSSTMKCPCWSANRSRFRDARLHAVSSRKMNSLHGLVALIRPVFLTGFQRLMVVSYCRPGSPQTWAAREISSRISRARWVSITSPVVTALVCHTPSVSTARMKPSVTRTEWLAFWYWTDSYAPPTTLNRPS